MYLMYTINENGDRVYTLKVNSKWYLNFFPTRSHNLLISQKRTEDGRPTLSAHPARFSPEDKYSRQRLTIKKRFGLLLTQKPEPIY